MKVRKAVIPAAGLGTRVLPASKAIPKEMLPIVDKPAIQYIVEEAVASGIEDILIVTSRGKSAIEDHFDRMPLLEQTLAAPDKKTLLDSVIAPAALANISYLRQQEITGLGAAVAYARSFVGGEPFVVLYADDVIFSKTPVTAQLIAAYQEFGLPALAIKQVSPEEIARYSSMKVAPLRDNLYHVDDMIEKPDSPEKVFSLFAILGRVLLTPEIFELLDGLPPGAGGEIQLTDAIKILANRGGATGVDFEGVRYDMGNKLGIMKAAVERALVHDEIGPSFRAWLGALKL
jgi:UTP--glucose-1-phosphate uridylyltransferase